MRPRSSRGRRRHHHRRRRHRHRHRHRRPWAASCYHRRAAAATAGRAATAARGRAAVHRSWPAASAVNAARRRGRRSLDRPPGRVNAPAAAESRTITRPAARAQGRRDPLAGDPPDRRGDAALPELHDARALRDRDDSVPGGRNGRARPTPRCSVSVTRLPTFFTEPRRTIARGTAAPRSDETRRRRNALPFADVDQRDRPVAGVRDVGQRSGPRPGGVGERARRDELRGRRLGSVEISATPPRAGSGATIVPPTSAGAPGVTCSGIVDVTFRVREIDDGDPPRDGHVGARSHDDDRAVGLLPDDDLRAARHELLARTAERRECARARRRPRARCRPGAPRPRSATNERPHAGAGAGRPDEADASAGRGDDRRPSLHLRRAAPARTPTRRPVRACRLRSRYSVLSSATISVRPRTASARGREASDAIASWRSERPFRRTTRPPGEVANSAFPAPMRAGRRGRGHRGIGQERPGRRGARRLVGVEVDDEVTVERPDEPPPVRLTAAAMPAPTSTIRPAPITSGRRERPGAASPRARSPAQATRSCRPAVRAAVPSWVAARPRRTRRPAAA